MISNHDPQPTLPNRPLQSTLPLPLRRSQQLLRVGGAAVAPGVSRRPVAVVQPADTTCCIAASYEARRWASNRNARWRGQAHFRRSCWSWRTRRLRDYSRRIAVRSSDAVLAPPVHRRDGLRADGREQDTARGGDRAGSSRPSRTCGESLRCSIGMAPNRFWQDCQRHAEADGLIGLLPSQSPPVAHLECATSGVARARGAAHAQGNPHHAAV